MRVALVHDWLTGMRGGEKVLAAMADLFPQADLLTLLHVPGSCPQLVQGRRVVTSFLDKLGVRKHYRWLLPLMPLAAGRLDARDYDLVISSSQCVAKGVRRSPGAIHLCYCHTPMRYIWAQQDQYARRLNPLAAAAMACLRGYLRHWDLRSAANVDVFLANSQNVADRIARIYSRPAQVVYPPVDTAFFTPDGSDREDFYLVASALAPYKCIDHAVDAFGRLGKPLRVIGSGQMMDKLRRQARANVTFLGWQSAEELRRHYRTCRAMVFPGEEDFGIAPLEAMACGAPVIAYGAGGALETVNDAAHSPQATGVLSQPHTVEALIDAVERFERIHRGFSPQSLAAWAANFGADRFRRQFIDALAPRLQEKGFPLPC